MSTFLRWSDAVGLATSLAVRWCWGRAAEGQPSKRKDARDDSRPAPEDEGGTTQHSGEECFKFDSQTCVILCCRLSHSRIVNFEQKKKQRRVAIRLRKGACSVVQRQRTRQSPIDLREATPNSHFQFHTYEGDVQHN